jgi:acetyl esterase/lipase
MKKQLQQTSSFLHQNLRFRFLMGLLVTLTSTHAQEHHAYIQRGDSLLELSLHASENANFQNSQQAPIILFAHGGGFSGGSRLQSKNVIFCRALHEAGFSVASIDYRLRQKRQGFHCDVAIEEKREAIAWAAEDLLAAWAYLQKSGYENVILAGSSAGAEAALYAAYHLGSEGIEAVISMAGAMEPAPSDAANIPLLAFHGECDQLVPYGEAIHHFCPEGSPGALLLQGGGALAHCSAQTRLFSYENKGHELTGELLSDANAIDAIATFIDDLHSHSPIAQRTRIASTSESTCSTPPAHLPCQ